MKKVNQPSHYTQTASQRLIKLVVEEVQAPLSIKWWVIFVVCCAIAFRGLGVSSWQMASEGVGVLGVNNHVPWGWDIVHFVFWIGLGHAGTLISSVLLLTRQPWRSPIARGAELMTLCAVICAGIFPVVHVGRIWMGWMTAPLPEVSGVWSNLGSPLMWDVLAVSTYFCLSISYWYMGLIPDFALLRDTCTGKRKWWYGLFALGWKGTSTQWYVYEKSSLIFAAILTPLVISVHSVVSFDFAVTVNAGWHETLYPPYFVIGAMLSGMAMIILILVCVKKLMGESVRVAITARVMNLASKLLLTLSLLMGFMYLWEHLCGLMQSEDVTELLHAKNQEWGGWAMWLMIVGNVLIPQCLWFNKIRRSAWSLVLVSLSVLGGMWLERFLIVVGSLKQSFLWGQCGDYLPSTTDVWMFVGSAGLFVCLYMVLVRLTPFFSLCELREMIISRKDEQANEK